MPKRAWQWAEGNGALGTAERSDPETSPSVKQISATTRGEGTERGAGKRGAGAESFSELLGDTERADVTFMVDGQQIVAHRCVLEARSSYFRNLFEAGGNNFLAPDAEAIAYVSAVRGAWKSMFVLRSARGERARPQIA